MLNREQRRAFMKRNKKNSALCRCPKCGYDTLFYTTTLSNLDQSEKHIVIKCSICDATVRDNEEVGKLVPPGITLPCTLDMFDKAMIYEAERAVKEKINEERNTTGLSENTSGNDGEKGHTEYEPSKEGATPDQET